MDDRTCRRLHPAVITHVPRPNADAQRPPLPGGEVCRTTERAGAHSLQFGTYALWAAGLQAALAVRPVPSCIISIARCVNDQALNEVSPGQDACSGVRSVMTLGHTDPIAALGRAGGQHHVER